MLRSLESTITVSERCSRATLEVLVRKLKARVNETRVQLKRVMDKKLKSLAVEKARATVSEAMGYTDIVYIPFLFYGAQLSYSAASHLGFQTLGRLDR